MPPLVFSGYAMRPWDGEAGRAWDPFRVHHVSPGREAGRAPGTPPGYATCPREGSPGEPPGPLLCTPRVPGTGARVSHPVLKAKPGVNHMCARINISHMGDQMNIII